MSKDYSINDLGFHGIHLINILNKLGKLPKWSEKEIILGDGDRIKLTQLTGKTLVRMKHLTIGTPFFNSEWCIKKYLNCILNLDYPKELLQLIFVDNGSTDRTFRLLDKFRKIYEREYGTIQLFKKKDRVRHKKSYLTTAWNAARVRNVIIEKSGSDDLIFVDSDCLIPPQSIHRLILGAEMGGDIVGGISVLKLDDTHPNLTAFSYTESGKGVNISLVNKEMPLTLLFPTWLIGRRWFVSVVGAGLSYYRSLVFDKLRFELDPEINEDVLLCLKANDSGFKIVADFGLWYEHYPLKYKIFDIPDYRWKLLFYLPFERKGKRLTLSLKVVDQLRQHFNFNYTDSTKESKMWSNGRVPNGKKEEFKKDDNMFEKL